MASVDRQPLRLSDGTRRFLQVVAVVLIGGGAVMVITGFIGFLSAIASFGDSTSPSPPITSFILFAAGAFATAIGSYVGKFAFLRPVSEIVATETGTAVGYTSQHVGKGLKASGFGDNKETIKVRCRGCGGIEREDARYCSGCGASMA